MFCGSSAQAATNTGVDLELYKGFEIPVEGTLGYETVVSPYTDWQAVWSTASPSPAVTLRVTSLSQQKNSGDEAWIVDAVGLGSEKMAAGDQAATVQFNAGIYDSTAGGSGGSGTGGGLSGEDDFDDPTGPTVASGIQWHQGAVGGPVLYTDVLLTLDLKTLGGWLLESLWIANTTKSSNELDAITGLGTDGSYDLGVLVSVLDADGSVLDDTYIRLGAEGTGTNDGTVHEWQSVADPSMLLNAEGASSLGFQYVVQSFNAGTDGSLTLSALSGKVHSFSVDYRAVVPEPCTYGSLCGVTVVAILWYCCKRLGRRFPVFNDKRADLKRCG